MVESEGVEGVVEEVVEEVEVDEEVEEVVAMLNTRMISRLGRFPANQVSQGCLHEK